MLVFDCWFLGAVVLLQAGVGLWGCGLGSGLGFGCWSGFGGWVVGVRVF